MVVERPGSEDTGRGFAAERTGFKEKVSRARRGGIRGQGRAKVLNTVRERLERSFEVGNLLLQLTYRKPHGAPLPHPQRDEHQGGKGKEKIAQHMPVGREWNRKEYLNKPRNVRLMRAGWRHAWFLTR